MKAVSLAAILLLLAGCKIVDVGATRVGGVNCTAARAMPGTPEYRNCRAVNTGEPRAIGRTPGGGIN